MADNEKTIEALLAGSPADGQPELILDRYRVVKTLGRGGMGVVYEARHELLNSRHAIKVLVNRLRGAGSEIIAERFLREARLCVSLRHPNLVLVTDCGIDKGHPVIVMDLIEGTELGKYTRGGKGVQSATVVRIGAQAASALNALHQRAIVHRDIKPSNLMLERASGRVVLMDLGISRQTDESSDMTMGAVIGTPAYMAPEQARSSSKVGTSADVYSLGAAFAALLSARAPVEAGTAHEMIQRVRERVYANGSILGLYPELAETQPPELVELLRDMTRFNPPERITCAQVRERLVAMDRAAGPLAGPTLDATLPIVVAPASDFVTPSSATPAQIGVTHHTEAESGTFMPPADASPMPSEAGPPPAAPTSPRPGSRGLPNWVVPLLLLPVAAVAFWLVLGRGAGSGSGQPESQPLPVSRPVPAQPAQPEPIAPRPEPPARDPTPGTVRTPPTEIVVQVPPSPPAAWARSQELPIPGAPALELVLVPPGQTKLGSDDPGKRQEKPRRLVTFTAPRWLGRYEVTCAQYAPFLAGKGAEADPGFGQFVMSEEGMQPAVGVGRLPVRGVTLAEAREYCLWVTQQCRIPVRLPGEAEWEYAARGPAARTWPWGDVWRPDRCRADSDTPSPVGSFPGGASWCGIEDLAGNVFEWTDDWYDVHRWQTLPERDPRPDPTPTVDGQTIVRGGCFTLERDVCRGASRAALPADLRDHRVGFRIITDHQPAPRPAQDPTP